MPVERIWGNVPQIRDGVIWKEKAPKMDEQVVDDDGGEEQPGRCQENPYAHVQLAEAADVKDDSAEHLLSLRSARDSFIPH